MPNKHKNLYLGIFTLIFIAFAIIRKDLFNIFYLGLGFTLGAIFTNKRSF